MSVSLGGLVNMSRLEDIINGLLAKMQLQSEQIHKLTTEVKTRATMADYKALEQQVESRLSSMERRISALERKVEEVQSHPLSQISENSQRLAALISANDAKLDFAEFEDFKDSWSAKLEERIVNIDKSKASQRCMDTMEDSQHRLLEQVVALQKMVSCKIDRVEIPLLHVATEKVENLLEFQKEASSRLDNVENALSAANKKIAQKEDKEAIVQRMQHIHKHLLTKADITWVSEEIAKPLDEVKQRVATGESLDQVWSMFKTRQVYKLAAFN